MLEHTGVKSFIFEIADRILEASRDSLAEEVWETPNIHHDAPQNWEEELEYIREQFRESFYSRTKQYLKLVGGSVLMLLLLDLYSSFTLPPQTYGLVIDLIGASILGRGLFHGKFSILFEVRNRTAGRELFIIPKKAKETVDGVWGIFLLILGISFQVVGILLF